VRKHFPVRVPPDDHVNVAVAGGDEELVPIGVRGLAGEFLVSEDVGITEDAVVLAG
jgi:hypothetical protein